MALEADRVHRFQQVSAVFRSVNIVTAITTDAVCIHDTLNEVISLHPVLVSRSIGIMREALLAEFVLFQLPVVLQIHPDLEADRPVVILAVDRIV